MAKIEGIWDFQREIGEYHRYVMCINAGVCCFYLIKTRNLYLNLKTPVNASFL